MRHLRKKRYSALVIILGVLFIIGLIMSPYYRFAQRVLHVSPVRSLFGFGDLKMIDGRVNVLVLGIPGGNHDGPMLSDSITVMNYDTKSNSVRSIGIPRDVWSSTLRDKINSAYAYGEAKVRGGGLRLAKAEVGSIIGFPIQYVVVINFHQFIDLIDTIGGVTVTVERSFIDREFPIEGKENDECGGDPEYQCRYKTISFTKGVTTMDGKTALEFVRSRHATGVEGSDFGRSKRQQIVLEAIKDKVGGIVLSLQLDKIEALYKSIDKLIVRDMSNQQAAYLMRNIVIKRNLKQSTTALPEELFEVPDYAQYDGKYVLVPEDRSYSALHSYVRQFLKMP